ncbi:hypothetical protein QVD17_14655 [Tagetes erecta]|uniref:Uncharacterized protein n=1 Tax=Tagetes erecta TaxID=13708 RepID=A0AAD8NY06_TARER|nr:hypothetical protein QVD17_14655 [Tagetes erecta]
MIFHEVKKTFLTFCITLHILSLWERFKKITMASNSNGSSEIGEYGRYVVQIEEDAKLSNRILRNTLHSITQLLDESKKKEPRNLLKLLGKSTGFNGVKREDNIRNAAQLLGKSKQILKILKTRQLPNLDQDSMAYIDKWRVLSMRQTPISVHISNYDAAASNTHPGNVE